MKILSKIRVGGVLLIVLSLLLSMMPTAAFAADVPVLLSASESSVDVTVSENITLTSQAGSVDLIVSDLTVKNNASIGSVEVTGISAAAENGWSLAPSDSEFESMQANAKKLYLGYGSHDFSAGELSVSDMDIVPGQTETISLSAKTGIVTADISSQKVATVVLTVGLKALEEKEAGLYDANGVMLASWDELVNTYEFDIENTTNENSFRTILSNNSSLSIGVELVISDSVNSIGECAFIGCTGLTSVTIGDSVNSIGEYAFNNCTDLTSVTIGDSVNSIGEWAFQNCTGLTSVTIGDSINSIGAAAFANCTGLTSVTIPDSVTSIGASAFLLTELTSVYFEHTTAPTFGTKCFYTSDGDMCTFYFKNSTVGNAFTTDYYNESYGTKSTNYNW